MVNRLFWTAQLVEKKQIVVVLLGNNLCIYRMLI